MMPAAVAGSIIRTVARRVGEGAVNGILTIRIGVAALEACRPMPFAAREKPSVTALARQTVGG
jgi:putative membrane protein